MGLFDKISAFFGSGFLKQAKVNKDPPVMLLETSFGRSKIKLIDWVSI